MDWQPIETAPKRGKLLLCRVPENPYRWPMAPHVRLKPSVFVGSKNTHNGAWQLATHWKYLPDMPK